MRCAACGSENPAEANFCNGCGAALSAHCVARGADNPAGSRFCNHCGGSLVGGGSDAVLEVLVDTADLKDANALLKGLS